MNLDFSIFRVFLNSSFLIISLTYTNQQCCRNLAISKHLYSWSNQSVISAILVLKTRITEITLIGFSAKIYWHGWFSTIFLFPKHSANIVSNMTNIWTFIALSHIKLQYTWCRRFQTVCSLQLEERWLLELIQNKDPISAKYCIIIVYIYLTGYNDTNMTKFT
jgi:hypothetical protein